MTTTADPEQEALCRRCGMSCHFAVPINGLPVVIDALRCKFLGRDEDGRYHCTVYERRFEVAPWCHSAAEALPKGLLAQDCPYGRAPGVRGKVRLHPARLQPLLPALRAEVARAGVPVGACLDSALRFLHEGGGRWSAHLSADGARHLFTRLDEGEAP